LIIQDEQERLKIADIYEKYRYKCLHIALNIVKNQEMAEDAVEDAFIEVIKQKNKILSMECSDLVPYLVTIVKSRAINIIKKTNRISDTPIEDLNETIESGEIPVDEQVISKQGFERLLAHVSNLDENYKIVFEMKYRDCLSNGEIAEILNITLKNVEMRLYRAKLKLRKLIEGEVKTNV
jgi:RNA polymerase sigma-70 factor (ECF subfamily)